MSETCCPQCCIPCVAGANFCHKCGGPACPVEKRPNHCSNAACGATAASEQALFCHLCGSPTATQLAGAAARGAAAPAPGLHSPAPVGAAAHLSAVPPAALRPAAAAAAGAAAQGQRGGRRRRTPPPVQPQQQQQPQPPLTPPHRDLTAPLGQHAEGGGSCEAPAAALQLAPWLVHAGLPCDGSVEAVWEIEAFADFVCATASERQRRTSLRTVLQKIVRERVSGDATVKLVGGWATGLAAFDSELDLVCEAPEEAGDPLAGIAAHLGEVGVHSTRRMVPGGPVLRFDAGSLAPRGCCDAGPTAGHIGCNFAVNVYAGTPSSHARHATTAVTSRLGRHPRHRKTFVVVRSILQQLRQPMGGEAGLTGYAIDLLFIAFLEHCSGSGSYGDPGWVLQEFAAFYSTFDFSALSVGIAPLFPPKQHPQDPLSIIDPADPRSNLAQGQGILQRLHMLLHNVTAAFARRAQRSTHSLLAALIPPQAMAARLDWLQKWGDVEVTRELAVAVAKGVAAFLEDPANDATKREFLQMAAWDSVQSMVRDARLLDKVVTRPELSNLRHRVPLLSRVLDSFKEDPEVRHHSDRSVANTVSKEDALVMLGDLLAFLQDPANAQYTAQLPEIARSSNMDVAIDVFTKMAAEPGSRLAAYQGSIPTLITALKSFSGEPEFREIGLQTIAAGVTEEVAVAMVKEAAWFLQDPANLAAKVEIMRTASGGDWGDPQLRAVEVDVFTRLAERPGSIVAPFRGHIPLLVDVLHERYYECPAVQEQIARAAMFAVTKDVALAIAREVADFLENPDNREATEELMRAALEDTTENIVGTYVRVFSTVAARPDSRLAPYRDSLAQLVDVLDAFRGDPDIDAQRRRAAKAAITRDVASAIFQDFEGALFSQQDGVSEQRASAAADSGLDSAEGSSTPEGRRTSPGEEPLRRQVWDGVQARVQSRVCEQLSTQGIGPRMAFFKHHGGGLSAELLSGLLAWQDEPELVQLRRRAAAACNESGVPTSVLSQPHSLDSFGSPPQFASSPPEPSPGSRAREAAVLAAAASRLHEHTGGAAADAADSGAAFFTPPDSEDEGGLLCDTAPIPMPAPVALDAEGAAGELQHTDAVPASYFSSPQTDPASPPAAGSEGSSWAAVGTVHQLPLTLQEVYRAAVAMDRAIRELHEARGDNDMSIRPWAVSPAAPWGGVRELRYRAQTPLGPSPCVEAQRYLLCTEGAAPCLVLHSSCQVPGVPFGSQFRTEALWRFAPSEAGVSFCAHYRLQEHQSLGRLRMFVQTGAEAAAAEGAAILVRLLSAPGALSRPTPPEATAAVEMLSGGPPAPAAAAPAGAVSPLPVAHSGDGSSAVPSGPHSDSGGGGPQQATRRRGRAKPDWVCGICSKANPDKYRRYCHGCGNLRPKGSAAAAAQQQQQQQPAQPQLKPPGPAPGVMPGFARPGMPGPAAACGGYPFFPMGPGFMPFPMAAMQQFAAGMQCAPTPFAGNPNAFAAAAAQRPAPQQPPPPQLTPASPSPSAGVVPQPTTSQDAPAAPAQEARQPRDGAPPGGRFIRRPKQCGVPP